MFEKIKARYFDGDPYAISKVKGWTISVKKKDAPSLIRDNENNKLETVDYYYEVTVASVGTNPNYPDKIDCSTDKFTLLLSPSSTFMAKNFLALRNGDRYVGFELHEEFEFEKGSNCHHIVLKVSFLTENHKSMTFSISMGQVRQPEKQKYEKYQDSLPRPWEVI